MDYQVTVPYIGGILSKNSYKFNRSRGTLPFVKKWMNELSEKVEQLNIPKAQEYEIHLYGKFTDERRPDLSNLHDVLADAIKERRGHPGLGVDDKVFRIIDDGYELGKWDPELLIGIVPVRIICQACGGNRVYLESPAEGYSCPSWGSNDADE